MNINNIYKIALKEINYNFSNYWIFLSAIIFFAVNFIIIYFGEIISGDYTQTDIRSLSLSIINLQMYMIPLFSFILSYDSILSEKESGILDLILSYRLTLLEVFLGKLFGNSIIFSLSFLIGFLPISVYLLFIGIKLNILIKFIFLSSWLNIIFNSFAIYISNLSKDRTVVILSSIFIWLFFVFIYDIIFTFFVIMTYNFFSNNALNMLLLFNPAELFRLISIYLFIPFDINDLFIINVSFLNFIYISFIIIFWLVLIFFGYVFFYNRSKK